MFRCFLVAACLFSSCEVVDTETDDDPANCPAACENLERLQCPGWQGSPGEDETFGTEDDISCVELCEIIVDEPSGTLYPACTAAAETCEDVENCFQ